MAHDPKLTAYIIELKTETRQVEKSNRNLFKNIIGELDGDLEDSYIFMEIAKKFIRKLDTPEMYSNDSTKKSMTAHQADIENENVNNNIHFHSSNFIIEGIVEGGRYGKRRKKRSIQDKQIESDVSEEDAITDNFYFLLYTPLSSDKSILLIQSYSDDSIDSVMKQFWEDFFKYPLLFKKPSIKRHIPNNIIDGFKREATISSLTYATEMLASTLLQSPTESNEREYKVTVKIEPKGEGLTYNDSNTIQNIGNAILNSLRLNSFDKKKGTLKNNTTQKTSPFSLSEQDFQIKPAIMLGNYIEIQHNESDFDRIKTYCFEILENIKSEIYPINAIQER